MSHTTSQQGILFLLFLILLLIILHLHSFPHSHQEDLDEHAIECLDDEEETGAGL